MDVIAAGDKGKPWGFWATIGFGALIIVLQIVAVIVVVVGFSVASAVLPGGVSHVSKSDGLLLSVSSCVTTPLTIGLCFLFAWARRRPPLVEYMGLSRPAQGQYSKWIVRIMVVLLCTDGLSRLLDRPLVEQVIVDWYLTAGSMPLLWLAVVVMAPLGEETMFRGFLFKGLLESRVGATGAILISSLAWAALHTQYDLFGMATVFAGGIVLGIARVRSGSLFVPLVMHAVWSLMAMVETTLYVEMVVR